MTIALAVSPLQEVLRLAEKRKRVFQRALPWSTWVLDLFTFAPIFGFWLGIVWFNIVFSYNLAVPWFLRPTALVAFGVLYVVLIRARFWWWIIRDLQSFLEFRCLDQEIEAILVRLNVEDCLGSGDGLLLSQLIDLEWRFSRQLSFYTFYLGNKTHRQNLRRLQELSRLHVRPF